MGGKTILVVDDNLLARLILKRALSQLGHQGEVVEIASMEMGLELLAECEFDIAFIDVDMRGMSGMALAGIIRINHPGTRVILMATNILVSTREGARRLGVGLISKPIDSGRLADCLAAEWVH